MFLLCTWRPTHRSGPTLWEVLGNPADDCWRLPTATLPATTLLATARDNPVGSCRRRPRRQIIIAVVSVRDGVSGGLAVWWSGCLAVFCVRACLSVSQSNVRHPRNGLVLPGGGCTVAGARGNPATGSACCFVSCGRPVWQVFWPLVLLACPSRVCSLARVCLSTTRLRRVSHRWRSLRMYTMCTCPENRLCAASPCALASNGVLGAKSSGRRSDLLHGVLCGMHCIYCIYCSHTTCPPPLLTRIMAWLSALR
jgi:hypothetical protein